jgi:hypothetical protein
MPKKVIPIKYTDRDFQSIKKSLIDHASRYYPDTFQDFSEASFGSLMLDTVSYVGDVLSFYLDYQTNETFLDTAVEYDNIVRIGKEMGYRAGYNPSAYGICTFYILIPSNTTGDAPDMDYAPMLKRRSLFESTAGGSYILEEDVDFSDPANQIRVATVDDTTGVPLSYAIRAYGRVASGKIVDEFVSLGDYVRFPKVELSNYDIADVLEIIDSQGNEYYEVDYISQDVVYRAVTNTGDESVEAPAILKPFVVPRRFVVEKERFTTYLQFGASSDAEVDNENVVRPNLVDPSQTVLQRQGKLYVSDYSFDPYKLIDTDEFGVAPSNTTLRITSRINDSASTNAAVGTITKIVDAKIEFKNENDLLPNEAFTVRTSIEVNNEKVISGDNRALDSQELKIRIMDYYATQNRAVTAQDYQAMAYAMPSQFGSIRRCRVIRDPDSLKNNLNMYVMSSNTNDNFSPAGEVIKQNLKTWLLKNKMVNDTIDILDAKIINFEISYEAVGRMDVSKYETLQKANEALKTNYRRKADVGEPFFITDIYKILKEVDEIVDVVDVTIKSMSGGEYSDVRFSVRENISSDGRYINIPINCIYEIKFPLVDIKGVIK